YQQLGFRNLRTLDCYRGQKKANQNVSGLELRKLPLAAIESLAQQVDWPPTWQNDLRAVAQQVEHHFSVGAFIEEQLGAFLVGRLEKNRVLQFFVLPHLRRRGIGTALFGQMSGSTPLALINVDQSDQAVAAFLKHLGLSVFLQQYEMECSL
ncbi:MAG: GNAT family N-acetyltransferase, partial [Bacteroidota bacterium]